MSAQNKLIRLPRFEGRIITEVSASSAFEVNLTQSDQTKAVVEISEESVDKLEFLLGNDGVIYVSIHSSASKMGFRTSNRVLKLTVYLPALSYLKASGASQVRLWVTERLEATAASASSIRYKGNPEVLNTRSSSAGSIRKTN